MKMSYKIALIVSVAVCVLAVVMFNGKDQPEPTQAVDAQANGPAAPAPRKTLRSDSPGDGSLTSMVRSQTPAPPNNTGSTLAADARSRVLAARAQDTPDDDSHRGDASESRKPEANTLASPPGNGSSGAIALARTGSGTAKQTTKPQPTAKVSRQNLDAVFASSGRPDVPGSNKSIHTKTPADTATFTPSPSDGADTPGTYVVQQGDTFSSIAIKLYNDERRWADLSQANPLVEPTKLKVGQELRLPGDRQKLSDEEPVPPGPGGIQTYTIRPGDSLSTVAETYYGDPTLWRTIYNFNRDKIGENPNAIQAGMTLKVPPSIQGAR